jgi:hypothetical protein
MNRGFMPRTRKRGLFTAAAALAIAVGAAGAAYAAVSATPTTAANGNAGYNATTTNAAGFTDGQAVVQPNQYGLTIAAGAQGAQGCNSTTGYGAQVGLLSNNHTTVYSVASAVGTIPAPGCPTGGVIPGGVAFPGLANVPYNHHVWVDWSLIKRTRTFRVLVCVIYRPGAPTATPTSTVTPTGTPTGTVTPTGTPTSTVTPAPGTHLHGVFHCHIRTITITRTAVLFQAQDLDAPATPVVGDVQGVQTRTVHVPNSTVFDNSGVGVNENQTGLTGCTGLAADGNTYPLTLAGPAAYVSAACQPVSIFEYATSSIASGPATDFQSLNTVEGISPNATGALVAPNNSISTTNTGPHAPTGSATGSHFQMNTGNAPTT